MECYEIEMRKRLDDGEQEGNEYVAGCPRSSVWLIGEEPDAHEPG